MNNRNETRNGETMTTETKNRKDAENAYAAERMQCESLLDEIRQAIEDLPAPDDSSLGSINWAHVGSVAHVRSRLEDVAACLRGDER